MTIVMNTPPEGMRWTLTINASLDGGSEILPTGFVFTRYDEVIQAALALKDTIDRLHGFSRETVGRIVGRDAGASAKQLGSLNNIPIRGG
jgi:hypothetical protein